MASKGRKGRQGGLTGKERMDRAREKIAARFDPELGKVVSDPLRVQMMATANARKVSAKSFAEEWDIPEWGANHHLRFLREREFIVVVEEVPRRGATEIFYRATKRAFISDADWSCLGAVTQEGISKAVVDDINTALQQAAEADTLDAREESILWWQEVPLDEITFPKAMKMQRLLIEKLVELGAETAQNQAEGKGGKSFPGVFSVMGFEGAPERKPVKRRRRKGKPGGKKRKRKK